MRLLVGILTAIACLFSTQTMADKRVALVIGNSQYQHVPNLNNPINDSEAVNLLLKDAGFDDVIAKENLGVNEMLRVVRDFTEQTRDADIAVIYYAGHGMEVGGINYLVPVDAVLRRDIDVEDEAVTLDRLLQVLEPAKRLRLIILDACRDNPFTKSMTRTMASRAVGRGLARVEPFTSDTLIAFAAKAGSTADDGRGTHSPFTNALLKHITTPGLDVRLAFGRVRDDVLEKTGSRQEPFVYGSLGGKAVTLAALSQDKQNDPKPAGDPDAPAARDYEAAAKLATKEGWDAFLTKYPSGFYSDLAKVQRAKLIPGTPIGPAKEGADSKAIRPPTAPASAKKKEEKNPSAAGAGMTDRQWQAAMRGPIGTPSWCAANRSWLAQTARSGKMHTISPSFPALFKEKCGG